MHPIEPAQFRTLWSEWYPGSAPHGWAMREGYSYRWFRVHSLPRGKRLPESEEEYATLLARHNAVIESVIGTAECVLLGYDYDGVYHFPASHPLAGWLPDAPPVMRLA